jgi:hypothetical protein
MLPYEELEAINMMALATSPSPIRPMFEVEIDRNAKVSFTLVRDESSLLKVVCMAAMLVVWGV